MFKPLLPALLAVIFATAASANEDVVRKSFEAKFGAKPESVTKAGYLGLYEIYAEGQILYSDDKGAIFIIGNPQLIDAKQNRNVTRERMSKLTAIKWNDLPLEQAIKQVRGDGKRVLATFEDPNCGYCKRLAKDIQKLDNVTVYTFLLPILAQDSVEKSKQIWCAPDRAKAWNDWMTEGKAPPAKNDCDTSAVAKNQEYGRKLNITGTPTLVFADGERVPGAISQEQIEKKLQSINGR